MTGDGVNDAPALKKADIGIAVDDATDAARGASDIVLTEPGLSVIIHAVLTSRCIFQRMKNYTVGPLTSRACLLLTAYNIDLCQLAPVHSPPPSPLPPFQCDRCSVLNIFLCFVWSVLQIYAVSITIRIVVS